MSMMQTSWAALINPVLAQPFNSGLLLPEITLVSGANVINHRLGRKMQGWVVTDRNGTADVYRTAPFNDLTLTLTASSGIKVSLFVF
jgi:hypothetical protein